MIQKVFAIYDSAAKAYLNPFQLPREEMALRAFRDVINSPSHELAAHPEDYTLFHLGEFDNRTGQYLNLQLGPKSLATGLSLKAPAKPDLLEDQTEVLKTIDANGANC